MTTTRICPKCGDPDMVPLRSINLKICPTCATEIPWPLTGDQTPVITPSRATRKTKE